VPPKIHAEEVEIDAALVGRLIGDQFPEWVGLSIAPDPTGTVNAIFRLGQDMVVRLPRIHWWADDLDRELDILPQLSGRLPLLVPEPLGRGRPGGGYPFTWAVYRWIPGQPWEPDQVSDQSRAARDLGEFVASLRSLDPTGPSSRRGQPLRSQDLQTRDAIAALRDDLDSSVVTALWDDALAVPPWEATPIWLHGDLLPTNVLLDEGGRITAVLDFGLAGVGDPAADMLPAWCVFAREERSTYRDAVELDEATWLRGRGWALSVALQLIPYYAGSAPHFAQLGRRMLAEVVQDAREM